MNKRSLLLNLLVLAGAVLVIPASAIAATGTYDGDCKACHGALKVGGGSSGGVKALSKNMTANDILIAKDKAGMAFVKDVANGGEYSDVIRNSVAAEVQAGATPPAPNPNKPIISPIAAQWDAEVGQELSIPLSVSDEEQNPVQLTAKPALPGATFSAEYTGDNGLPTFDYLWTPAADKANKVVTVTFTAQETDTAKKFKSKPIKAKIRVWPAGDRDQASVQKVVISTAKWLDGKLSLKGKVTLNKLLSAQEKTDFLARNDFTVNITQGSDGTGTDIEVAQPITLDAKGGWTLIDLPLPAASSCNLTMEFEGKMATRKIAGDKSCIK